MTVKPNFQPQNLNGSARSLNAHQTKNTVGQTVPLKAEAELKYTERRLKIMSRLYEQSCKEIFTLRQQLNDAHRALEKVSHTSI